MIKLTIISGPPAGSDGFGEYSLLDEDGIRGSTLGRLKVKPAGMKR